MSNSSTKYLFEGDTFFNPQLQLEDGEKKTKVVIFVSFNFINAYYYSTGGIGVQ